MTTMKLKILVMLYEYLFWYVQFSPLNCYSLPQIIICILLEHMQFILKTLVVHTVMDISD